MCVCVLHICIYMNLMHVFDARVSVAIIWCVSACVCVCVPRLCERVWVGEREQESKRARERKFVSMCVCRRARTRT